FHQLFLLSLVSSPYNVRASLLVLCYEGSIFDKTPLTNLPDFSSPYLFASSTASLIDTFSGISSEYNISNVAIRNKVLSTEASRGSVQFSRCLEMVSSIDCLLSITPSTRYVKNSSFFSFSNM